MPQRAKYLACHCCGSGYSCGAGSIPGPGTSASRGCNQKKRALKIGREKDRSHTRVFICQKNMHINGLGFTSSSPLALESPDLDGTAALALLNLQLPDGRLLRFIPRTASANSA